MSSKQCLPDFLQRLMHRNTHIVSYKDDIAIIFCFAHSAMFNDSGWD